MPIVFAGGLLAALGLLSGLLLVVAPLGLVATTPGVLPWVLFPLFTLVGGFLLIAGSADPAARAPVRTVAALLLALALVAAIALTAAGTGFARVQPAGTASLWYVLVLAGLVGAIGSAARRPGPGGTPVA
ncbi:MAG: hypothetical protein ACTHL8_17865 [Burkholderiaceae bacterium]